MFFGDIVHWWYKELTGIRPDPDQVGFKHFYIQPFFPEGLEFAEASYDCMYGQIRSEWKREGEEIAMVVEVPANTTSTIILPGGELLINNEPVKKSRTSRQFEMGSGVYNLVLRNSTKN
jgi:alpha-L-rhamnosidase